MRFSRILAAVAFAAASLFTAAQAAPITYTLSGTMSGSLGGTDFSNQPFTWTITGDTTAFVGPPPNEAVFAFTNTISISGFSTADLTNSPYFVAANALGADSVAFIDPLASEGVLFASPDFAFYDARNAIGPIPVEFIDGSSAIATDQGTLAVTNATDGSFQASTVPEPATLAIFGAGLLGAGALKRRRKAKAS